jgi:hypothetical protein
MICQASHIGAGKLWKEFLTGLATYLAHKVDKAVTEESEQIIKPKKRKRKKEFLNASIIKCGVSAPKD